MISRLDWRQGLRDTAFDASKSPQNWHEFARPIHLSADSDYDLYIYLYPTMPNLHQRMQYKKTLKTTIYIYRYMNIHVYRSLPKLVGFNPTVHYCSIHVQYLFPCHWLTKVSYILEGKRCLDNISAGGTRVDFITSLYRCVMCCSVLVASILSEENSLNAPKLTLSYTNQCLSNYSLLIRSLKWV